MDFTNNDDKYAVFHNEMGIVGFENETIARELFQKVEGIAILYRIDNNGSMTILEQKNIDKTTIHQKLKALGVELAGHCSDLYCPVTLETSKIVENYEFKDSVTRFTSNIDGKLWFDIPLANDDFKKES